MTFLRIVIRSSLLVHARRVGIPGDLSFPVVNTIVIHDDPAQASAAA